MSILCSLFAAMHIFIVARSAWACGLVPDSAVGNKNVLWDRAASIGRYFSGQGCAFEKINAPPGVDVTVFVHFESKTCKFCCDGVVVAVQHVPSSEFPLRLGICGHRGAKFAITPITFDEQALLEAKVGERVRPKTCSVAHSAAASTGTDSVLASSSLALSDHDISALVRRGVEASADNALGLLSSLGHFGNGRGAMLFGGTNRLAFPPAASPPPAVSSSIQCSFGHPCTPHTYSLDENSCDLCHRDIDAGSAGLRCSACDFDVCDACSSTSPPLATSTQAAFGVDAASLSPATRLPLHPSASASPPQPLSRACASSDHAIAEPAAAACVHSGGTAAGVYGRETFHLTDIQDASTEAPRTPAPSSAVQKGSRVRIESLQSKPELNGRMGVCGAFNQENERWMVQIDANERGPALQVLIRTANLKMIRSVLKDLDAFDENALRMAHRFAGQMLRLPSLSVVNPICLHANAVGVRGVCVPARDAGRMNLCKCSVSTSLALKMCSKLFNASNAKIMNFCLSIIARGYRGRNVLKFERRCATVAVAPLYHFPLRCTLPLALQLATCCPFLLSLSPSRLMRSQSNTRTIVFSDNDTTVKLLSFALMPVAVAVPVGTRCRFKVQLIQAPPSLGATSFGVATSNVGLERTSTIGNQRNT